MSIHLLSAQDVDKDVQAVLNQWGGAKILNFVASEAFAGNFYKYEAIAIRFNDEIPALKRLIQQHLLFDSSADTGLRQVHLTFIGFLCSDIFKTHKELVDKIFYKIRKEYEVSEGEGQSTSDELSKSLFGETIFPRGHKTIKLLIQLFTTAPVNLFYIQREVEGVSTIKAHVNIMEYKSCARYISACIETFNKQLKIAAPYQSSLQTTSVSPQERENNEKEELDDKLPILRFGFIKNNLQQILDLNIRNPTFR